MQYFSILEVITAKLQLRFKIRFHKSKKGTFVYKIVKNQLCILIIFRLSVILKTIF